MSEKAMFVRVALWFGVIGTVGLLPGYLNAQTTSQTSGSHTQSKPSAKTIFAAAFKLYQSGQFEVAVNAFERGLSVDPDDGKARYYLGECLEHLGRTEEAVQNLEMAVKLAPSSEEGVLAAAKLPMLRNPAANNVESLSKVDSFLQRAESRQTTTLDGRRILVVSLSGVYKNEKSASIDDLDWGRASAFTESTIVIPCRLANGLKPRCVHRRTTMAGATNVTDHDEDELGLFVRPSDSSAVLTLVKGIR